MGQSTPEQVANDLYRKIATKYGTPGSLMQSVVIPMTSHTPMTTVDGTRTFYTTNMSCPSTERFLTISVLPAGSGDIDRVIVSEDLDTDGTAEYSYLSPYMVSGICANGFMSCDAGTWNNCVNLKWTSDGSGKITMAFASNQELGSCYCINNNCGTDIAIRQLPYILYSLGSGVIGALQQATGAKYAVSDGVVSGMTIHYTGQSTTTCAERRNTSVIGINPQTIASLTSLYSNPGAISSRVEQETTIARSNPNSPYNSVMNSFSMQNKEGSVNDCSIIRTVTMDVKTEDAYYIWQPWLSLNLTCYWGRDSVNGCTTTINHDTNEDGIYDATYTRSHRDMGTDASKANHARVADYDVSQLQQTYNLPSNFVKKLLWTETYSFFDGGGKGSDGNVTTYTIKWQKITTPVCPTDTIFNSTDLKCYTENLMEMMSDNCASMMSDSNCKLREESIDGVKTYTNGTPTYLKPTPSCKTVSGVMTSQDACRDWWVKNRTYWCTGNKSYDFSYALERAGKVQTSVERSGNTATFTDIQRDSQGAKTYVNNIIHLNDSQSGEGCVIACKTQRPTDFTPATDTVNAVMVQRPAQSYDYYYKECADNVCPVDDTTGEIVVTDCSCLSDMGEAVAIMEVMNAAGKDMICSSGNRQ